MTYIVETESDRWEFPTLLEAMNFAYSLAQEVKIYAAGILALPATRLTGSHC
jgi:hypothetical protein